MPKGPNRPLVSLLMGGHPQSTIRTIEQQAFKNQLPCFPRYQRRMSSKRWCIRILPLLIPRIPRDSQGGTNRLNIDSPVLCSIGLIVLLAARYDLDLSSTIIVDTWRTTARDFSRMVLWPLGFMTRLRMTTMLSPFVAVVFRYTYFRSLNGRQCPRVSWRKRSFL